MLERKPPIKRRHQCERTVSSRFASVPGAFAKAPGWVFPVWLGDSRRLLVRRPEDMVGRTGGVSRDNRWITYTETASEGDFWIATIRQERQ